MTKSRILLVLLASAMNLGAAALDPKTEATHNELRALRDGLLSAMNKGDIDGQLSYLHTNAVITWHNAETSRGKEGVRDYYNRLMGGPNKMVEKFSAEINVDELTILHGENTGISFGSSIEHFKMANGRSFDLKGRWTATLVKENGRWLIASLHVSTNLFDNIILTLAKRYAIWGVASAFVIGAGLGWFFARRRTLSPARPG
jgi:hypothetical protein